MKETDLESLLRVGRIGPAKDALGPPAGFAQQVFARYLREKRQGQIVLRTSLASIVTACCILASIIGLNFDQLTSPPVNDVDPVVEMVNSVWDSAGN